jgi:hypothetical protein
MRVELYLAGTFSKRVQPPVIGGKGHFGPVPQGRRFIAHHLVQRDAHRLAASQRLRVAAAARAAPSLDDSEVVGGRGPPGLQTGHCKALAGVLIGCWPHACAAPSWDFMRCLRVSTKGSTR